LRSCQDLNYLESGIVCFTTVEHLPKAPIQEALIDIRVAMPPDFQVAALKNFGKGLEQRFPEAQEQHRVAHGFQFSPVGEPQVIAPTRTLDGYRFISKAGGKIVQAQREGFTFNKLRPYTRWDEFSGEANELWQRYIEIAKPQTVHRLAVRYINRIELPQELLDMRELCILFPDIPDAISNQGLAEYFQRFVVPRSDGIVSAVSLSLDNSIPPAKPAIILDIDVWNTLQQPAGVDTLWHQFEALHALKNQIFDASLTEKAKALFR
jgi:uncharacterized protein (TIGR04255 family)